MTRQLLFLVTGLLISYGCIEAWPLIAGPSLTIDSPRDSAVAPDGIIEISGVAHRTASLTLDGAPLLHKQDGSFSKTMTFPVGGSILTFTAADRFGRTVSATRTIFVPATSSAATISS